MKPRKTTARRTKKPSIQGATAEQNPMMSKRTELATTIFPFGYVLSDAEIMSMQENLKRCEDKDILISKRIDEVKLLIEKFKQQQKENARRITGLKWSLSTARRLPDDVLIEVLKTCVLDLEVSPYLLAQVCKKFQSMMLHIPKIWSKIIIDSRAERWSSEEYYGYHYCTTFEDLRKILKRSGGVPLDITVHNASSEMTQLLLAERHRWHHLQFEKSDYWTGQTEDPSETLFEIPNTPMDLEEFCLSSECHENVVSWVMVAKPRVLRLHNFSVEPLKQLTWWDELHTLDIDGEFEDPDLPSSVFSIIKALRLQLSRLQLRCIPFVDSDLSSGIEFPRLQHLELEQVDYWWKFSAPNITSLSLYPSNPAPSGTVLTYPNVTEVEYNGYYAPLSSETLSLPKVVSMSLDSLMVGRPGVNFVWSNADGTLSQAVAKKISISGAYDDIARISYKDLMASLRPHTNLMSLHIQDLRLPVTFYKAFMKGSSQKGVLCPRLRELVVDLRIGNRSTKVNFTQYNEVFETIAAERGQGDNPLQRLSITWPDSILDEPTEYIS
ncbi:hypothetical protein CPB86DRAFT_826818 [Serendipita vermifera]|nr:hypothetical protein CPB86DRAFT_826818 [Serendipita vermifera]